MEEFRVIKDKLQKENIFEQISDLKALLLIQSVIYFHKSFVSNELSSYLASHIAETQLFPLKTLTFQREINFGKLFNSS